VLVATRLKASSFNAAPTQDLSDGELFYIIEYGARFTGMPMGRRLDQKRGGRVAAGPLPSTFAEFDARGNRRMEELNPKPQSRCLYCSS